MQTKSILFAENWCSDKSGGLVIRLINFSEVFERTAPLRLEGGFGHGEFLSRMAEVHPDEDFIGIEKIVSQYLND